MLGVLLGTENPVQTEKLRLGKHTKSKLNNGDTAGTHARKELLYCDTIKRRQKSNHSPQTEMKHWKTCLRPMLNKNWF